MSMQYDISIIIPTYNIEKYVGSTLESVINQKDIQLEVLVVDDGSSDKTKEIVKKYTKKYPFIKLLTNERTKGVSGARNTAIAHMQGKTCFFLDGDDLLLPNVLHLLFKKMEETNKPIILGRLTLFCQQRWHYKKSIKQQNLSENQYPIGTFAQHLYSSQLIKENNILFPENSVTGEDRIFFCHAFCLVSDIPNIDEYAYIYRINHKKTSSPAKNSLSFINHFYQIRTLLEKYDKMDFYPSYFQSQFIPEWLHRTFYILPENTDTTNSYLKDFSHALTGMREVFEPTLKNKLGEKSDAFLKAVDENDYNSMLEILKSTNSLSPYETYIGIKESQVQNNWMFLRLLHRAKNTLTSFNSIKSLYYIFYLGMRSKIFLIASK